MGQTDRPLHDQHNMWQKNMKISDGKMPVKNVVILCRISDSRNSDKKHAEQEVAASCERLPQ